MGSLLVYAGYGAGVVAAGYAALIALSDSDTTTALSSERVEYYRDKVVWITGASSGIGLELARHIARANQAGTRLVLTARTKSKLDEAKAGTTVLVHYTGWLQADGTQFDTSRSRGQPFQFQLGKGSVIKGWEDGVPGMKVGGQRRLFIPPQLGYGDRGAGDAIPPKADLVFDVELVEVR